MGELGSRYGMYTVLTTRGLRLSPSCPSMSWTFFVLRSNYGSLILVREDLADRPLEVTGPWLANLDVVAIRIATSFGSL